MNTKTSMPSTPQAAPPVSTPVPSKPPALTLEEARELAREGLRLRQQVNERFARMRALTEDDLKLRTR